MMQQRVCWGPQAAWLQTLQWPLPLLLLRQPYVLQEQHSSSDRCSGTVIAIACTPLGVLRPITVAWRG
jgi:hypothetical protein